MYHTCICYIHPILAATIMCLPGCIILALVTYIQCWQPPSCAYLVASYLHLLHTSNVGSHHLVLIWLHHTCTCYIHPMLAATILCLSGCIILALVTYIQCWQPPSCAYLVASYFHLLHTSNVGSHHHVLIWLHHNTSNVALVTYIQCWQPPSCAYLVASYLHLLHTSNVGSHHLVLIWLHHTCTCYIHPMLAATILCLSGCIILALVTYIQCWQPPSCAYLVASYLHLLHTSNVGSHHLVLIWLHHTCTCYIHPMLAATILCLSGCIILALVTYIQCWQPPSCPYLVASYLHLLHTSNVGSHHLVVLYLHYLVASYLHLLHTSNVGSHHLVLIWLHHTCTCYIHPMLAATILCLSGCIILALVTYIQCWQPPSCAYLVASYLHLLHTSNVGSHHLVLIWLHHTCTCYIHPMLAATILCLSGCIILALVTYIQCWQPPSCAYLVVSYLHLLHTSNVGSHHLVLIWLHHTCTCYIHPMFTYIQWQPPSCAYLVASYLHLLHTSNVGSHHLVLLIWLHHTCTCYIHPMLAATILCLSGCIILALATYIQCWQPPSCAYLVASYLHLLHTSNVGSHHLVLIWLHHTCTCYIHPMLAATILCLFGALNFRPR